MPTHQRDVRRLRQSIRAELETLERRVLLSGATVQIASPTVTQGAGEFEIDATLTDSSPIQTAGISQSNIVVTGPSGPLAVVGETATVSAGGTTVVASYFVKSPGGIWDAAANGNYSVTFQPNQVFDTAGQSAASVTTQFVASGLTPLAGPIAVAFEPSGDFYVTVPGTTGKTLEVTYSDPGGINVSSINSGNLGSFVGSLNISLESATSLDSGTVVDADYFMGAPNGAFFPSDNTGYHVVMAPNDPVTNTAGQDVSAGILALYEVEIDPFDPSYAFTGSSASGFVAQNIAYQSNGDTILAGVEGNTTDGQGQIVVERLNPDGSLDTSFATNGIFTGPAGDNQAAYGLSIESDDSILLSGTSGGDFLLEHLTADGAPDTRFGSAGTGAVTTAVTTFSSSEIAYSVAAAPDGTIVTAGESDGSWAFARYSASGSLLNDFLIPLPDGKDGAVGQVAVLPDGSIVAAGTDDTNVDVADVNDQGQLVSTFNSGQIEQLSRLQAPGVLDPAIGMAIDDQNRIVVSAADNGDFAVDRLDAGGSPDPSFGGTGTVTTPIDTTSGALTADDADSVVIQPGAQIVVTGSATDSSGNLQTAVVEYNEDGTLDTTTFAGGVYTFVPQINVAALAASDNISPDVAAAASGELNTFGAANGDSVAVGSSQQSSSGGGTDVSSLLLPGIITSLSANPLTAGNSTYSFSVTYADNSNLSAASLASTAAITVTKEAPVPTASANRGFATADSATPLQVVSASVDTSGDGSPRTVTYTVAAPDGSWSSNDDGAYQIQLNGKAIQDDDGNHAAAGALGNFSVDIPVPTGLSISGTVFDDSNADGSQETGEAGIAGVVVFADENGSGNPSGQPQATTNASGQYTIGGLTGDATYAIREVVPSGFSQTFPAGNAAQSVSLTSASVSNENFGQILGITPATLSGTVYDGGNGSPESGVTVFLDTNDNGVLDAGETSAVTDSNGNYEFTGLAPGAYQVAEVLPVGQTASVSDASVTVRSGANTGPSFADVPVPANSDHAPNLTGRILSSINTSVVAGSKGALTVLIRNNGDAAARGQATVTLFASSSQTLLNAISITSAPAKLNLKAGGSEKLTLHFTYPPSLPNGSYYLIASIDSGDAIPESDKTDNLAVSSSTETIAAPFVGLSPSLTPPTTLTSGNTAKALLSVTNFGNTAASGTVDVDIFASTDQTLDSGDVMISTVPLHLRLKPNQSRSYSLRLKLAAGLLAAGNDYLIARIDGSGSIPTATAVAASLTTVS